MNGKVVQSPGLWVDADHDSIALDGKRVVEQEKIYLLLYKPKGYITTYRDPEGRPTCMISFLTSAWVAAGRQVGSRHQRAADPDERQRFRGSYNRSRA